jgi:S-adenosylmethionine synthetase
VLWPNVCILGCPLRETCLPHLPIPPTGALLTVTNTTELTIADIRFESSRIGILASDCPGLQVLNCQFLDVDKPIKDDARALTPRGVRQGPSGHQGVWFGLAASSSALARSCGRPRRSS